jgi:hypothetical protein
MFIKKIKYFYFIENFNLKELEKIKKISSAALTGRPRVTMHQCRLAG